MSLYRNLPVRHYTNPFWRYAIETAFWYGLIYWMGGAWAVVIFAVLCLGVVFSMKISNYLQHYGLRRIRLPSGKFERVQPWHSWSAARKVDNWLFFNMQRHPDHHAAAGRRYLLMQHHGGDMSPQLPGGYGKMFGLVLFPRRWFKTMDPLVDQWRARFYPQVEDWTRFDYARQNILVHGAARNRLVAGLRKPIGDAPAPGLSSIRDMRGGLLDVERVARLLYMTHAEDASAISAPSAVAIFEAAGAHGLIPASAAERLAEAATMCRNLRGVLRLVAEDGFAVQSASPKVKAVIARACGMDDFDALGAAVRDTASRAATDIDALTA